MYVTPLCLSFILNCDIIKLTEECWSNDKKSVQKNSKQILHVHLRKYSIGITKHENVGARYFTYSYEVT